MGGVKFIVGGGMMVDGSKSDLKGEKPNIHEGEECRVRDIVQCSIAEKR